MKAGIAFDRSGPGFFSARILFITKHYFHCEIIKDALSLISESNSEIIMLENLKKILGIKTIDFAQLIQEGAIVLDVRTTSEFANGHIKGSVNVPLNKLPQYLPKLKDKTQPIITCCASGSRSAEAVNVLHYHGYTNLHNGGSWFRLNAKIYG